MKECCMTKKYKHITLDDRTLIQTQLQQRFKPAAIDQAVLSGAEEYQQEMDNAN